MITRALLFLPRKIFIAGRTQQEVLGVVTKLNGEGFWATIDVLGEHSKNEEEVETALKEYERLVYAINIRGLKATISIKLTHLGLGLGFSYCFNTIKELAGYARQQNVGIEFDMEEFKYNPETIEIFRSLSKPEDGNRICLQANIKDSCKLLEDLYDKGYHTRLVKGAYKESSDIAFHDQIYIKEQFMLLIYMAISKTIHDRRNNIIGPRHAIGTRDREIINYARWLIEDPPLLPKNCIEFQLLFGYIALGRQLLSEGYPVRIYLPYGDDQTALPYIWRRLKTPHTWRLLFDWLLNFGRY